MVLHCIRHGETQHNLAGVFSGWGNEGLRPEQEEGLNCIEFDASEYDIIYCSPAFRCKETARCLEVVPHVEDPRIAERHFGRFEGLSVDEVRRAYPEAFSAFQRLDGDFVIPGGESRAQHFARIEEWLQEAMVHRRVLAITHGGTIDFLYRLGTGEELHGGETVYAGPNAALSAFEVVWPEVRLIQHGVPLGA